MDERTTVHVDLILRHEFGSAANALRERLDALYHANAAKGCLRSGGTLKAALRIMDECATAVVAKTIEQVASAASDAEAFALISAAVDTFLSFLRVEFEAALELATGNGRESGNDSAAFAAADARLQELETRVMRHLEIAGFSFKQPRGGASRAPPDKPSVMHSGGRPLAKHWDEMWAAIAVKLYLGDLKPQTQAEIERAMKDWFAAHDIDVGDTPVRDRARTLWCALQQAE